MCALPAAMEFFHSCVRCINATVGGVSIALLTQRGYRVFTMGYTLLRAVYLDRKLLKYTNSYCIFKHLTFSQSEHVIWICLPATSVAQHAH